MNLKKFTAFALVAAQLSVVAPAFADPPAPAPIVLPDVPLQPGEPDVGAALSPMKRGQQAPFSGVLLSPRATATLLVQINSINDQIKIEVDHARAEEIAKCDFRVKETTTTMTADQKILQARSDAQAKQIDVLNDQLKREEGARSNGTLLLGLGVAGGVILTVLTTFAVSRSTK